MLLVSCLGLIVENSLGTGRLAIFKKLWLQLLLGLVRSNSNMAQILCTQIVNWLLEDDIVTIVPNVFNFFIKLV